MYNRTALWDINERCNLKCEYCYHLMDGLSWTGKEVTLEKARGIIDYFADNKVDVIYLVGGEPFLHRNLKEIMRYSHEKGIKNHITTNGTLTSKYDDAELMELTDLIEMSVDSTDPAYLASVGRSPKFNKLEESIAVFKKHGKEFGIITVVTRNNYEDVEKLVDWARGTGAAHLKFQMVWLPKENALHAKHSLNEQQIMAFSEKFSSQYESNELVTEYFSLLKAASGYEHFNYNCKAYTSFLYVNVDGVVTRCPSLREEIPQPAFEPARRVCDKMSLDCLSCFNLVESFNFRLKQTVSAQHG